MLSAVGWRVEPRAVPGSAVRYRIGAIVVGVFVSIAAEIILSGGDASGFLSSLWTSTIGTPDGFQSFAIIATPLILTGLAAAIPLRLGLWNIGADGQMYLGAWMAFLIGSAFPHMATVPLILLMVLGGALGGAIWILVPTFALIRFGVNEIITTLILNFVGAYWLVYWAGHTWAESASAGGVQSRLVPDQSVIGGLHFGNVLLPLGLLVACLLALGVWLVLRSTRLGFRMKIVGSSPRAAAYSGMSVARITAVALLTGGAIAGIAGVIEMLGNVHRYAPALSNNTGYTGVVIAVLAGASELGVITLGLLFAAIAVGNNLLQVKGITSDAQFAVFGVMLLIAAFGQGLARLRVVRTRRAPAADVTREEGVRVA